MERPTVLNRTAHNLLHRLFDDEFLAVGKRYHCVRRFLNALNDLCIEDKFSLFMTGFPSVPFLFSLVFAQ